MSRRAALAALLALSAVACGGVDVKQLYPSERSCGGWGQPCQNPGVNECCAGLACNGARCCVRGGNACGRDQDCCSLSCIDGRCACSRQSYACAGDADCCEGKGLECAAAPGWSGSCEVKPGGRCTVDYECVSLACGAGASCDCSGANDGCYRDADCCSGSCVFPGGDLFRGQCYCAPSGSWCDTGAHCCSGGCDPFTSQCD